MNLKEIKNLTGLSCAQLHRILNGNAVTRDTFTQYLYKGNPTGDKLAVKIKMSIENSIRDGRELLSHFDRNFPNLLIPAPDEDLYPLELALFAKQIISLRDSGINPESLRVLSIINNQ